MATRRIAQSIEEHGSFNWAHVAQIIDETLDDQRKAKEDSQGKGKA